MALICGAYTVLMENKKFKYAGAWNFLCFGPDGIELHLKNYGNIVLIQGENKDAKAIDSEEDAGVSSNGSGKSSLQEIIVWTLYGKTIKRPEKIGINDVIHNRVGKDCRAVVEFDKYRVERIRHGKGKNAKHSLCLWEIDEQRNIVKDLTLGDERLTAKKIVEKVGLSYEAFVNICIFTDDQRSCFLECDTDTKLEIVENLMQLGIYREWFENAKEEKKNTKKQIELKAKEYALLLNNQEDAETRLELAQKQHQTWQTQKATEKIALEAKIAEKTAMLGKTDNGQALLLYQQAQEKIATINLKIPDLEAARVKVIDRQTLVRAKDAVLKKEAQEITEKFNECSSKARTLLASRKEKEAEIIDLESEVPGTSCGKCKGTISEENIAAYIAVLQKEISDINLDIKACKMSSEAIGAASEEIKANQAKLKALDEQTEKQRKSIDDELSSLSTQLTVASQVREPKADSAEFLMQQQIEELNRQLEEKKKEIDGESPYEKMLELSKLQLNKVALGVSEKDKEVKELERHMPYLDFWFHGFGPEGIRKWVIEGIIPDLNTRINYWLQFLIDNMITLQFNDKLEEKIERNPSDGDPYIYYAMSTGQRRRLNLSVGHSFAYITELSAEAIPSIIFLDEVTTNVDPLGVQGIYNMITELTQDKQVFVTTHDPDLVRMLQGASVIKLIHENGYTKMV